MRESKAQKESPSRLRVELIVQVLGKQMTASGAAKRLGVSRKTYYKWEKRFLSATLDAVSDKEAGRPGKEVDEEKVELQRRLADLEKQVSVLKHAVRIRDLLQPREPPRRGRPPKKRRRKRRSLKQEQLDLGGRSDGETGVVPGQGIEGDRGLQVHSEASFSRDGEGEDANGPDGSFEPGGSDVVEDRQRFGEKTWGKKSGEGEGG